MQIFPAIDILNARAVRLLYGKADMVTDYGTPLSAALDFAKQGATNLHIVDLDGAFGGMGVSDKIIYDIANKTDLFIQSGGGLRTLDDIKKRFDSGVKRVILGTVAYENQNLLEKALNLYGDQIAVGIDAKNGLLAVKGWEQSTRENASDFALKMKNLGVKTIIFTDIAKDGALSGVNIESTAQISSSTGLNVIASGGMKSIDEIDSLKNKKIYGVILGRSIYTGDINLKEAVTKANEL